MKRRTMISKMLLLGGASALKLDGKDSGGISLQNIRAAAAYSADMRGKSLLIIQNGKAIFEEYPNGFSANEPHKIYSGTKGFWNLAALAAAEDGILELNERAADTLPEWREDKWKSRITIRQLLDFTSGLDPYFELHGDGISDRDELALRRTLVAEPGGAFIYGPCSLQVFHLIMKRKLAQHHRTPTQYLERRVLAPMGLGPQRYVADKSGNPLLASGFTLSARQWAQVGKSILLDGKQIVSRESLKNCTCGTARNRAFSLGFWNNGAAGGGRAQEVNVEMMLEEKWPKQRWNNACLQRNAPSDLMASIGSGSQRLYIVPSQNLVVVRQGRDSKFTDADFLRLLYGH